LAGEKNVCLKQDNCRSGIKYVSRVLFFCLSAVKQQFLISKMRYILVGECLHVNIYKINKNIV